MKRVLTWAEARDLADNCKKHGGLVVSTNGCFDLLHKGHISYLEAARALGDLLIVGLNSDASVATLKGPGRPVTSEADRAAIVSALRCVDAVCIFGEPTPLEWLKSLEPNIHCKGGDYKAETMIETPVVRVWGGRVQVLPFVKGYSTTSILERKK